MTATAQADAFRQAFKNEFENFKKSESVKKELKNLRASIRMMRKNPVGIVPHHRRKNSAQEQTRNEDLLDVAQDPMTEYLETQEACLSKTSQLNLPNVQGSSQERRALSAGGFRDEGLNNFISAKDCDSSNSGKETITACSSIASQNNRKEFKVKVIKMNKYDSTAREQAKREKEAKEKKELEERHRASKILMEHGITQSKGLQVSKRAAIERQRSSRAGKKTSDLISGYEREIENYKHRIQLLEQEEIQRMAKESEYREELANNHGKPKQFFQVPLLATGERSSRRCVQKLAFHQAADREQLRRKNCMKSYQWDLDEEHFKLKELIEKRETELKKLLQGYSGEASEHENLFTRAQLASFKHSAGELSSIEPSPANNACGQETRLVSQDGAVEEVQLDLSFVKAAKRKRRNSKIGSKQQISSPVRRLSLNHNCSPYKQSILITGPASSQGKKSSCRRGSLKKNHSTRSHQRKESENYLKYLQLNPYLLPNNDFSSEFHLQSSSRNNSEVDELSDFSGRNRSCAAPHIKIILNEDEEEAKQTTSAVQSTINGSLAPSKDDTLLEMPKSEARKNRLVLQPLKIRAKYDIVSRGSQKRSTVILKPEQIVRKHEHTNTNPFSFMSEARCGEKKASVYQRNQDNYQNQIKNSLGSRKSSRASDRLANFKKLEEMNQTQTMQMNKRNKNGKLEPMALLSNRQGQRAASSNRRSSSNNSTCAN